MHHKGGMIAAILVVLMIALNFQSIIAAAAGQQWDVVRDDEGYLHAVYVDIDPDFNPKNMTNSDTEIFYKDNVGAKGIGWGSFWKWNEPVRLSYTEWNSVYPRIAIDDVLGYLYVIWIEKTPNNDTIMYTGSEDGKEWTYPLVCGYFPDIRGDPKLDLYASNGTLYITWKHGGHMEVIADSDGDMIPDNKDAHPFTYDAPDNVEFTPDAVAYDPTLGVSVAVKYLNESKAAPEISGIEPEVYLNASIGKYFSIESPTNISEAYIQEKIDISELPSVVRLNQLRMYYLDSGHWRIMMKKSLGENTGVGIENSVVWAKSTHFSTFTSADTLSYDSDGDNLLDGEEINVNNVPSAAIHTFSGGNAEEMLNYSGPGNKTVYVNISVENGEKPNVDVAWLSINGTINPFKKAENILQVNGVFYSADIYENWIAYEWNQSIYVKNIVTNQIIKVTSHATGIQGIDYNPRIYGNWVMWTREKLPPQPDHGSAYYMMAWNFTTHEEICIGSGGWSPDLWNGISVWATYHGVLVIRENGTEYRIGDGLIYNPKIWGDYLVYSKYLSGSGGYGLYLYDRANNSVIFKIEGVDWPEYDIAGNYLVYTYADMGGLEIYNPITGDEQFISEPDGVSDIAAYEDGFSYTNHSGVVKYFDLWSKENSIISQADTSRTYLSTWGNRTIWINDTGSVFMVEKPYDEDIFMKVGDFETPSWSSSAYISFSGIPEISYPMNRYIRENYEENMTNISIPITIYSSSPANITLDGLNVSVSPIEADPNDNDTDGDGIVDGWGSNVPGEWTLATNMLLQDFIGTAKSREVAGDVDAMTGNLRLTRNLISVGNGPCKIDLSIIYNSQRAEEKTIFGAGWNSPYLAYLNLSNSSYVGYFDGTGTEWRFKAYANGLYSTPPGTDMRLVKDSGSYYIVSRDGSLKIFNGTGKLIRIEDRNSRGLNMSYNSTGKLKEIDSDTGMHIYFTYEDTGYIGQISG